MPPILSVRVFFIFILSVSVFLVSCGGGSSDSNVSKNSLKGVAGTLARITNLGVDGVNDTMTLNGISYATDTATFRRNDGSGSSNQSNFRLGETIIVEGLINPDGKTGTATRIIFDDTLTGSVTKELEDSFIEVLGQRVDINDETVLHGFNNVVDLKKDQLVQVSGIVRKNRSVYATSISLITEIEGILVVGYISNINESAETFQLNNLLVDYSTPLVGIGKDPLRNGFYVEVTSVEPLKNGVLVGSFIDVLSKDALQPNTFYKIAGKVNRFSSLADFDLNGLPARTTEKTIFTHTSGMGDNSEHIFRINEKIIISGNTNAEGVLEADQLILVTESSKIFATGLVEAIDLDNKTISVLGVTASIDEQISSVLDQNTDYSTSPIALREFSVGDFVFFDSYRNADNKHIVWDLRRVFFEFPDTSVLGMVFSSDEQLGVIDLIEHRIETDSNTEYYSIAGNLLSKEAFFLELATKNILLYVEGKLVGEKAIKADVIAIDIAGSFK